MSDHLVAVSVLNGEVQIGDRVAYATRFASSMDMQIATVLEITGKENWRGVIEPKLKVEVTKGSGYYQELPYKTTIGCLDRVIKL
jgi:hypothetical protein